MLGAHLNVGTGRLCANYQRFWLFVFALGDLLDLCEHVGDVVDGQAARVIAAVHCRLLEVVQIPIVDGHLLAVELRVAHLLGSFALGAGRLGLRANFRAWTRRVARLFHFTRLDSAQLLQLLKLRRIQHAWIRRFVTRTKRRYRNTLRIGDGRRFTMFRRF